MARQVTIRAFDAWKLDPKNWDEFFRLITEDGLSLRNAAMKMKQPYTLVFPFVHDGAEMQKRYELALKAFARRLMDETLPIADSVRKSNTPARVSAAKLAIEARHIYAGHADRDRFGEVVRVERATEAPSDVGLLGFASELLKLVKSGAAPAEKLIGEETAAEPVALPRVAAK